MIGVQYCERSNLEHTSEAFLVIVDKSGSSRVTLIQKRRRGESSWIDRLVKGFGKRMGQLS